ncbi:MAG: OmpH family outer membrane protein [Gammaproteobacteria bacterium]
MKKIFSIVAAGAILLGVSGVSMADTKIGVIDLNKIISADKQVSSLQNQLKKQFEPRNKAVVDAQKNLQSDIEKYNKDSATLKGDELKKEQQKILDEQKKLQDLQTSFQHDLMDAQNKSMQTILKRVETAVNKIAVDQKYDLVVTKVSTVYNNPSYEITDKVIDALKDTK